MCSFRQLRVIVFILLMFNFQIQVSSMYDDIDETNLDIRHNNNQATNKFYDGNGPLHCAVLYNQIKIVETIASQTENINIKNIRNQTPLHIACIKNYFESAEILLNYHANINCLDSEEKTPIYHTAENNNVDIFKLLIKWGAEINTPDIWGNTPLHIALKKGFYEIAKSLIAKRPEINFVNQDGDTPLDMLIKTTLSPKNKKVIHFDENSKNLARILLALGAKSNKYPTDYLKSLAQEKNKNNYNDGYFETCEIL